MVRYHTLEEWLAGVERQGWRLVRHQGHEHYDATSEDGRVVGTWRGDAAGHLPNEPNPPRLEEQTEEPLQQNTSPVQLSGETASFSSGLVLPDGSPVQSEPEQLP